MYRYETHLHTFPVSRCGKAGVRETLEFYHALGYDGVFITNHFLDGNINIEKEKSYEEKIAFYFSDFEQAVPMGKELGIRVFCGVELSYGGTDFLIYGLDKGWYLAHPEIMTMPKRDELAFMMEQGALVMQAHPFREASYIDHIRLFPRHIHGVEIINANRKAEENNLAAIYAKHYNLIEFAGTDNHKAANQQKLAGVSFEEPINSVEDFIAKVKANKLGIFTLVNE
jgi:hypothetical protein